MTKWEYVTVPLIVHATKQILDQWGEERYELVQVVPAPTTTASWPTSSAPKPEAARMNTESDHRVWHQTDLKTPPSKEQKCRRP